MLKPNMVRLAHELVKACQLPQHMAMCTTGSTECPLLTAGGAMCFHTDAYVDFLQQIAYNSAEVAAESADYALQSSVCFSETAWCAAAAAAAAAPPHRRRLAFRTWRCVDAAQSPPASRRRRPYARTYAGASVAAARALSMAATDVAINWMGGQTHARPDCASGFSYVNDVVLAILSMLHTHERVMFVSTDAWHPSGVEEAFYTTDRVLCVSLHRYTEGFFPGSGGVDDRGHGAGTNHSINMPVLEGLDDDQIASLFVPVVAAAAERFQPSCVVYCAGAGVLAGDRLGCLNVTLEGYGRCLQAVLDIGRPLLVLGGCGFNQINTARAWCHATALICQTEVAEQLPPHDFVEYYLPESTLKVATIEMTNKNSAESIQATLDASMKAAEQIPARAAAPTPPNAAAAEGDTATGATPAASTEADPNLASPGLTANEAPLTSPLGQPLPGNGADVPLDAASALEPAASSTEAPVPMETESEAAAASEGAPTPMATEEEGAAPA